MIYIMHTLSTLPYAYEALEPHFDAATMRLHHDKHHQAYLDKFNAALTDLPELAAMDAEDLLWQYQDLVEGKIAADIATAIRNHGGGFAHHNLLWSTMSAAGPRQAVGELAAAITSQFFSFDSFKQQFSELAAKHFGAGWAWLVLTKEGQLAMYSLPNQDSPLLQQHYPLMGIDVWEHAYYLHYQNRRPDYIEAAWQVLDWEQIENRYQAGLKRLAV